MASTSIQFIGIDKVLAAFEARDVDCWSIWHNKEFHMKGCGADELRSYLNMIADSGTTATYRLQIYETLNEPSEIKSNTAHDGSFNFKLFLGGSEQAARGGRNDIIGRHYGYPTAEDRILERLDAIEKKFDDDIEPQDETFVQSLGNAFIGMIQEPDKLGQFLDSLSKLFGTQVPHRPAIGQIERVGQMDPPAPGSREIQKPVLSQPETTEEKLQRLGAAIDTLEKFDSNLVGHLEKLATIAQQTPERFKAILSIFDAS